MWGTKHKVVLLILYLLVNPISAQNIAHYNINVGDEFYFRLVSSTNVATGEEAAMSLTGDTQQDIIHPGEIVTVKVLLTTREDIPDIGPSYPIFPVLNLQGPSFSINRTLNRFSIQFFAPADLEPPNFVTVDWGSHFFDPDGILQSYRGEISYVSYEGNAVGNYIVADVNLERISSFEATMARYAQYLPILVIIFIIVFVLLVWFVYKKWKTRVGGTIETWPQEEN